jgi:hypothetical protein
MGVDHRTTLSPLEPSASVSGMSVRGWSTGCVAVALLTICSAAAGSSTPSRSLPLPATGNVSVARVTITPSRAGALTTSPPRLSVVNAQALPPSTLVVASISRVRSRRGTYTAVTAILRRPESAASPVQSAPAGRLTLRVSRGYTLGPVALASNVLYLNRLPAFPIEKPSSPIVLAGELPKITASRALLDARRLAYDQNVPLADMELLGFEYVSVGLARLAGTQTSFAVSLGLARIANANAVELRFPKGVRVVRAAGPQGTDAAAVGGTLQVTASGGFFQEGVLHRFSVELDKPPPKASFVTVRASTHYFENVLPFTQRVRLPS